MNFRSASRAHKMYYGSCIVLTLFFGFVAESIADNHKCESDIGCDTSSNSSMVIDREAKSQWCSGDNVDDITFFVEHSDDPNWTGKVGVNFTFPNVECEYKVALLVNLLIDKEEDCTNEVFHNSDAYPNEVHSDDVEICISESLNQSSAYNCQKKKFSLSYNHVFTGCYALRFVHEGAPYYVRGSAFLTTNYIRTEIEEPKWECLYSEMGLSDGLSEAEVKFKLQIEAHASISYMQLVYTPMQNLSGSTDNDCDEPSENDKHKWLIYMNNDQTEMNRNCTKYGNNPNIHKIDCELTLRLPQNVGYCFKIRVWDPRCHLHSIWKKQSMCDSVYSCIKDRVTSGSMIHNDSISLNYVFFLPIVVAVMLIILIVTCTILFVYRSHSRYAEQRVWVNTNLRNLKIATDIDSVETTDDEAMKGSNNSDESDAIILLYARGSPTFMSLMSDFREILKNYCGCHVQDWYAASEWDAVATVGPSAWVADLLKQKHRAIWIDTPRARSLIDMQGQNNRMNELKRSYQRCLDEDTISDFRDIALPSVLDLAKRNVTPEPTLQYNKHFVVRLEGFDAAANRNEDPFEDLSPHTRYLIPHHLSELCSHISSWRINVNTQHLKSEGAQFRERLIRMKNNNS